MTAARRCAACRKRLYRTGVQCKNCDAWYCQRAWPFCHYAHQRTAHRTKTKAHRHART